MTADIMMVTYNRLDLTMETLKSLMETTDHPFNLIIVDNASTDATVETLRRIRKEPWFHSSGFLEDFRFIENTGNEGIARGRNRALQSSTEKWLVTIDNDVILNHGWLPEAIKILEKHKNYGAIGVNFETTQYPIHNDSFGLEWQDKPQGNLGTACMVFPRAIHKMLGFFNYKDYSPFYGLEDSDWGMRIRVAGLKLGYLKQPGRHLGEGSADVGPYRAFKTHEHDSNVSTFQKNCSLYWNKKKPIYIPYP
jgi:GT2 family glycosyltransferase